MGQVDDLRQLDEALSRRRGWLAGATIAIAGALVSSIVAAAVIIEKPARGIGPRAEPAASQNATSSASESTRETVAENQAAEKQKGAPFVAPTLSPSPPVSVIDAARIVDKAGPGRRQAPKPPADPVPTLAIDPTIAAKGGEPRPLHLSINTDGVVPDGSTIVVAGLPNGSRLSAGRADPMGTWTLAPDDLDDLRMTLAAQATGTREIVVRLMTPDGHVANERHAKLVLPTAEPVAAGRASATTTTAVPSRTMSAADLDVLVRHGRELQRVGYVAGARLFYQRAMDAGSAEGARALGETYDPVVLRKLGARGLEPDPALAQKWYARSKELEAIK